MQLSRLYILGSLCVLLASCGKSTSVDPKAVETTDKYFTAVVSSDWDTIWSCYSSSFKDKCLEFYGSEEKAKEFMLSSSPLPSSAEATVQKTEHKGKVVNVYVVVNDGNGKKISGKSCILVLAEENGVWLIDNSKPWNP